MPESAAQLGVNSDQSGLESDLPLVGVNDLVEANPPVTRVTSSDREPGQGVGLSPLRRANQSGLTVIKSKSKLSRARAGSPCLGFNQG